MAEALRVLELGSGVSAAHAAKLLGDYGADVVKVEEPEGDLTRGRGPFPDGASEPEQSGLFLGLNLNKRGAVLDLASADGRAALDTLIAWADVLVHDYPRLRALELGLDPQRLLAQRPDLVVLSITPFGTTGPYRDYRAEEITIANGGGWAAQCPSTHREQELPPLKIFGHQCKLMAGIAGALAALAVSRDARRSGVGEFIDLSEQEYLASVLEGNIPIYAYRGDIPRRYDTRMLTPWRIFEARGGPIFLCCVEQDQWLRLIDFMGRPEWSQLEVFRETPERALNQDVLHNFVEEFIAGWDVFELYHAAQKQRICFAPVMSLADLASNEHLRERGFFVTVDHPRAGELEYPAPPVIGRHGRAAIRRPAPLLGEHTDAVLAEATPAAAHGNGTAPRLPLDGVRVLDLTWVWAGPFGSLNLAHLGADVIRIESAKRADLYRRFPILPPGVEPSLDNSGMFIQWNQGKKSVATDLGDPRGIEIVKRFVAESDVVVENFGTGVLERLGLGYEELKQINPSLVMASVTGYGQTGPYREYMGYGPAAAPLTGLSSVTGFIGGGPEEFGISMPDPTAGITAALAIVAALERRDETGEGDHLDVTLWESTAALAIEPWMEFVFSGTQPERMGNRDPWMAPHGCFPCTGDDEWVSIACAADDEWSALAAQIDPALSDDPRFRSLNDRKTHEDELEALVSAWTAERDRWRITEQLQEIGVAAFPTLTAKDIVEDPHLNERGVIERLDHPAIGVREHIGIPWRLSRRPNGVRAPAPCLGADTDALLADVLGYGEAQIAELNAAGVLV